MKNKINVVSLWDDGFPLIDLNNKKKHEKLRIIQEYYHQYDPYYIRAGVDEKTRTKFDTQWNEYKGLEDLHFLTEIRKHFHERTWEMWMGNYLKNSRFTISSGNEGPDFILNKNIYLECIAVNKGAGNDKVPEMQFGIVQNVPINQMLLRILCGIREKGLHRYFGRDGKDGWKDRSWFNGDSPYIIAINSASLDFLLGKQDWSRILFGRGDETINIRTKELSNLYCPYIQKANSEKISTIIFETKEYENVSAIIFSDKNILEDTLDIEESFVLVHNPYAKNKLDEKLFGHIEQWKAEKDSVVRIGEMVEVVKKQKKS